MEESKEEAPRPRPSVVVPRWGAPIAKEKIRRQVASPNEDEVAEQLAAVVPMPPEDVAEEEAKEAEEAVEEEAMETAAAVATATAPKTAKPKAPAKKPDAEAVAITARRAPKPVAERIVADGPAIESLPTALQPVAARVKASLEASTIGIRPTDGLFVPSDRRAFKHFIIQTYRKYQLPRLPAEADPDACAKLETSKETKAFLYQEFVRDFIQKPSPYRGVLVYHGLGSGKTCSSIIAMEALYQMDRSKPIYVLTPASLDPNYRDDIVNKCGALMMRINAFWTFVPVTFPLSNPPPSEVKFAVETLGIPIYSLKKQRGYWIPDPDPAKKPNLTEANQSQIKEQIKAVMEGRIEFIHYNGLTADTVRGWACDPVQRARFDGSTVIIDEVHNLIRTINNSNLEENYKDEPRSMAQYEPVGCGTARMYRISYLLYRMLCSAVGCKIIALSATPIINFPQEVAILANLLAGDARMVEVSMVGLQKQKEMLEYLKRHPEVDFAELIPKPESSTCLIRASPVPSGFRKVIDERSGTLRGFVYNMPIAGSAEEIARERDLVSWFERVRAGITAKGLPAVAVPAFRSTQRLPDTEKEFRETFINEEALSVKNDTKLVLMARLSGLVSYYKGGREDYMPKLESDEAVYLDMSDLQLKKYTEQRLVEIEREQDQTKKKGKPEEKTGAITYSDVTASQNATFKIFSRAACNFVFPGEEKRPVPSNYRELLKIVGAKPGAAKAEGENAAEEGDAAPVDAVDREGADTIVPAADAEPAAEGSSSSAAGPAPTARGRSSAYEVALTAAVQSLKDRSKELFAKGKLEEMSPKFQAIIDRIKPSEGPVLVYSNFKTVEGVGMFGVALEAQEDYVKFDIVPSGGGGWDLAPDLMANGRGKLRYMTYTGDEDRAKRQTLLAIFNGQWHKLAPAFASKVREFVEADNNMEGKIAKVFMITQSGAEGISLANVRQVHIMEAYWNYVRLDQVKGRAIRICSHKSLPPEKRSVKVFTYITKFSEKQMADRLVVETLKNFDGGKSTDQYIFELLNKKQQLAKSVINIMQQSAVDCELNAAENGTLACYRFTGAPTMEPMFHPLLAEHLSEGAATVRATVRPQ